MKTERLIIDQIKETDKEDYFINISHDKKVLETFICRYADSLEEFDFSSYPGTGPVCDPPEGNRASYRYYYILRRKRRFL